MARKFSLADLPETIPVFPLPGALLLPRARLPLNIFEPRYLAMLEDTLKTPHRLIGMIQPIVMPEGKATGRLHQIGCAGRVTAFQETEDGRYLITLSGAAASGSASCRRASRPISGRGSTGRASSATSGGPSSDPDFDRPAFLKVLARFFDTAQLSSDWDSLKEADVELLINSLSILCPFDPEEKQALLEAPTLANRRETLVTLMEFALRSSGDEGAMQ